MANAAMELLESSLETRLENTFHIKAKLSECADRHRIAIVASLLYAYDQVRLLLNYICILLSMKLTIQIHNKLASI